MLAIVQVPEHGLGVLAAGGAQGAVGGHGHGVQVTVMADVVGLQLAVLQRPNLRKIDIELRTYFFKNCHFSAKSRPNCS